MGTGKQRGALSSDSGIRARWPAVVIFFVLTLVTQVGGVLGFAGWWLSGRWYQGRVARALFAAGFYLVATLGVIPLVAKPCGRVPLPLYSTGAVPLAPRSLWYCLTNRHYVEPAVRDLVVGAARKLRSGYPGSVVHYLDAGFPFWDGFVMAPHLSHRNAKVIDLAFCYKRTNGTGFGASPSPIGYGISEGPRPGEPQPYRGQFSWLRWGLPASPWIDGGNRLDEDRTRALLRSLLEDSRTSKVLLELHLQCRLGLRHDKLRYQQLQAARHDDHLHLVLR